jgi:predicted kinase
MGSPRTGKTTLARHLADKIQANVVSITDIRLNQTGGNPQFTVDELEAAYAFSVGEVVKNLQQDRNVIWEGTFQSDKAREKITRLIETLLGGYHIVPIVLRAQSDVINKRLEQTQAEHVDRDVSPERAVALSQQYPAFPGGKEFDTSSNSVETLVRKILVEYNDSRREYA